MDESTISFTEELPELVPGSMPKYASTALQYFDEHSSETATIEDIESFVRERDQPNADESRIKIRLHHSTLPKLAEVGILEYDVRSNTARCRGHSAIETAIDQLSGYPDSEA